MYFSEGLEAKRRKMIDALGSGWIELDVGLCVTCARVQSGCFVVRAVPGLKGQKGYQCTIFCDSKGFYGPIRSHPRTAVIDAWSAFLKKIDDITPEFYDIVRKWDDAHSNKGG